nr:efflux RND transporter periplasmic adaptor subunit [uncultured Desulfuromonas sp.]
METQQNTNGSMVRKRVTILLRMTAVFALIGAAYAAYWLMIGRYQVFTDNAYVAGNIAQITPLTNGRVETVEVNDTDFVEAGTVLVRLDKADAELALAKAKADLAETVRRVRTLYHGDEALQAVVAQRRTDLNTARDDLARRSALRGTGAVAEEEITHAADAVASARQALDSARQQLQANRALVDQTTLEEHPQVAQAVALLRERYLAWKRTDIVAPISGYIARRNVQAGQWVTSGAPLMALVPLNQVWVDANFKETQLRQMRIGQPVELVSDLLGKQVVYHGRVAGFSAGTGAVFSLLPAQNATGNWIKVVQRLAVRIALDPQELAANPLQIGLSMAVTVDIHTTDGARLSEGRANTRPTDSAVPNVWRDEADTLAQRIIVANRAPQATP